MDINSIRPSRLIIDLDILSGNIKRIKALLSKNTKLMAVIKGNAYGHGSIMLAKTFIEAGAEYLGVSTIEEGIELRRNNIQAPILLLNYTPEDQYELALEHNLILTIYDLDSAKELNYLAASLGVNARIHIKIDTGMGRIGFLPNKDSIEDIIKISKLSNIKIDGIYSHFSRADENNKKFTKNQYNKFKWVIDKLEDNIDIGVKHISNSLGILKYPEYNLDMVRAGVILYGYNPSDTVDINEYGLESTFELVSEISHIKRVEKGTGIGYGHNFIAKDDIYIGTLPIGYADGYNRLLSNKGYIYIGEKKYRIIGNICMDQLMVNLEKDYYEPGTKVKLIDNKLKYISVDTISRKINTINYEFLCMISRRVPRVYKKNGKVIDVIEYLAK